MNAKPERQQLSKIKNIIPWKQIQEEHDAGMSLKDIRNKYGLTIANVATALRLNYFSRNLTVIKNNAKHRASQQMKKFWTDTPEIGRERIIRAQNSVPCKNVKNFLKDNNILFVEEYNPNVPDRHFHIDIALPDKKIAIEINGRWHYTDSTCKHFTEYHIQRKKSIEQLGWVVIDIRTNICFNFNNKPYWKQLVNDLSSSETKTNFDYITYTPQNLYHTFCRGCGKQTFPNKNTQPKGYEFSCKKCAGLKRRKTINLSNEELKDLYDTLGMGQLSRHLNLSQSFIRRIMKERQIPFKKNREIDISDDQLQDMIYNNGMPCTAKFFGISIDVLTRIVDYRRLERPHGLGINGHRYKHNK